MKKKNPHHGSTLDDFLESLPDDEQVEIKAEGLKQSICAQVRKAMKKQGIGVVQLQKMLDTSPSQVQRLLDEHYTGVSLKNLVKLYSVLGKELKIIAG